MPETHDHPIRGRCHSAFLAATENQVHRFYGERKHELFGTLPGEFVELGPRTGGNFRYYPKASCVIAIEPNLRMHERLRKKAETFGLDLRGLRGERLDLPDESTDCVICTLVLCSVDDPASVLAEAKRVLRPGGRFVFVEHVAAESGSMLRGFQNLVRGPWSYWFEGCCPNRETWASLEEAGFSDLDIDRFWVVSPLNHTAPQIAGVAIK